ncbi:glycosyltransferase [Flavobacterium arcticum]|uniref:dolichyl-phosphate beta-glucosyltransferase n=1 Tax=Flavobacterium arcticum TaxID=1784713 RepID=A0A345H8G1_9FLAO|nr:glycosyltransferase [Flavobacterium arcticum]AXG72871.1 glycosyltransferase [Flavobacterium arcticum]KAF2510465.1 glycosyltransferase [Flavobacterium arcticum]
MKILIVDDQELVLLSLEKALTDQGYEVERANNIIDAVTKFDDFAPDLLIADMNMPSAPEDEKGYMNITFDEKAPGLDLINYLRNIRKDATPIMILSGNLDEEIIERGFELGANDYMKKPLSLNEIAIRVKRLIGGGSNIKRADTKEKFIQETCIGVVIPCYNEEERLLGDDFKRFVNKNLGYHLCFVNDGSKDNTLEVLKELRKGNEDHISIYDCEKNGGKAEAVRLGMLHLAEQSQFDYIGFLDADLSTDFADFQDLVKTISNSDYQVVSGSRISRIGADITKESARKVISMSINFIIRKTLGMEFRDTQCGAKIMTRKVVEETFQKKFLTKWLFDVEIFMRMRNIYGLKEAQAMLCEKPLNRWIHADGSKLSFKDSLKIIGQIGQIAFHYR